MVASHRAALFKLGQCPKSKGTIHQVIEWKGASPAGVLAPFHPPLSAMAPIVSAARRFIYPLEGFRMHGSAAARLRIGDDLIVIAMHHQYGILICRRKQARRHGEAERRWVKDPSGIFSNNRSTDHGRS
jgi:hypothetical protein